MGAPFSRAVDFNMPKKTPSEKRQSRNRSTPSSTSSTASKVRSVLGLNKLPSSSRQSRSHTNLRTPGLHLRPSQKSYRSRLIRDPSRGTQSTARSLASDATSSFFSGFSYRSLSPNDSTDHSRVLVIEDVESNMGNSKTKITASSSPEGDTDSVYFLEKLSVSIEDLESHQALFADEGRQAKAKKFVIAWRQGLSYPKTKKGTVSTDIPIAATTHCKTGINPCTRCCRQHFVTRYSNENLLADLVHKESLEKFIEETEQFHATSSICIKEDLKRKQLYDSVHHADSADGLVKKGKLEEPADDDMQLTIQFNVPPPIHIEYAPEKTLLERDLEEFGDLNLLKKKSDTFSFSNAVKRTSILRKKKVKVL